MGKVIDNKLDELTEQEKMQKFESRKLERANSFVILAIKERRKGNFKEAAGWYREAAEEYRALGREDLARKYEDAAEGVLAERLMKEAEVKKEKEAKWMEMSEGIDKEKWKKFIEEECKTKRMLRWARNRLEDYAKAKKKWRNTDEYWSYHELMKIIDNKLDELTEQEKMQKEGRMVEYRLIEQAKKLERLAIVDREKGNLKGAENQYREAAKIYRQLGYEDLAKRCEGIAEEILEERLKKERIIGKPSKGKKLYDNVCPKCGSIDIELLPTGGFICHKCGHKFNLAERRYERPIGRFFRRGGVGIKKTSRKIYEGKPPENIEKYAKIILPIIAIGIGILILIFWPRLWIIGIPAMIIGIGYLLIVAPEMDRFSFKQRAGVLIIITGCLFTFVFSEIKYGLALLFLGGAFIVYDWIPKGRGKLVIKFIELVATLILLVLGVPSFLDWAGISISPGALVFFSVLNTFILFMLWSFSGGQSMKESLEEELLKKQIEEIEAREKAKSVPENPNNKPEETPVNNEGENNKPEENNGGGEE